MSFLNDYGYDFQETGNKKLSDLAKELPKNMLIRNIMNFYARLSLGRNKNMRKVISAMLAVK
jgi:hypothetical protein